MMIWKVDFRQDYWRGRLNLLVRPAELFRFPFFFSLSLSSPFHFLLLHHLEFTLGSPFDWTMWSAWSSCSSCGNVSGWKNRTRTCQGSCGSTCVGSSDERVPCSQGIIFTNLSIVDVCMSLWINRCFQERWWYISFNLITFKKKRDSTLKTYLSNAWLNSYISQPPLPFIFFTMLGTADGMPRQWTSWSVWSNCSDCTSSAWRLRLRSCNGTCGPDCIGNVSENATCPEGKLRVCQKKHSHVESKVRVKQAAAKLF